MATGVAIGSAILGAAFQIGGAISSAKATKEEAKETVEDYWASIQELRVKSGETEIEAARRISTAKEEGVAALQEQGAQAGYETNEAMRKAAQSASAGESRIAAGGVRASGTALAARQQDVDIAYAGAERIAESGAAQLKLGGLKLKNTMADITAATSLLTAEYGRTEAEYRRKAKRYGTLPDEVNPYAGIGGTFGMFRGGAGFR